MIVCSKATDALARKAWGKDKIIISTTERLISELQLDPSVTMPRRDAYVVSESDVAKPKVMAAFKDAAAKKHPDVKIIMVVRPRSTMAAGDGIDKVLMNPKPDQLREAVADLVNAIEDKMIQMQEGPEEKYEPVEFAEDPIPEPTPGPPMPEQEEPEDLPVSEPEPEVPVITNTEADDAMLQRIKECRNVADVSIVAREITAAKVVKDLMSENQEYVAIEERLKALQKQIYAVMADTAIPTLSEKLERVRALMYDRSYYAVKGSSILESRVEEIVKTLSEKTKELLQEKMEDVDKTILFYSKGQATEHINFPNLSSLLNTRANLILDLSLLVNENASVFDSADKLISDASMEVTRINTELTGNVIMDNQMKARGVRLTSEDGLKVINKAIELSVDNAEDFKEYKAKLDVMSRKVADLMKADEDIIAVQNNIIKYLTARGVEDTVVATSYIKQALRIYVGEEGTGRTIVPYLISKMHSRSSANVLHIDLTGTSKLANYGVKAMGIYDWMESMPEEQLCVVAGAISEGDNLESTVQRLSNLLVRAADFYRMINVVIRPDQKLLFDTLAPDTLSVNYITDLAVANLDKTKKVIEEMVMPNMAQKVITNKCQQCTERIVARLGLVERMNVGYLRIPNIEQIVDCSLEGIDPSAVDVVNDLFMEVLKNA